MSKQWQDWVYVLLGCWLLVSPWGMGYLANQAASANGWGIGAVLVAFNIISISKVFGPGQATFNILLGIWLIISPSMLNFTTDREVAMNVILEGTVIIAFAFWQIYAVSKVSKE